MRAIGYVRRRFSDEDVGALDSLTVQDMAGSMDAAAGSWGQIKEIESRLRLTTTDPVMQIIGFCRSGGHQLTTILGTDTDNPLLEGVEAELNDGVGSAFQRQIPAEFGDAPIRRIDGVYRGSSWQAGAGGDTRFFALGARS